MTEQLSRIKKEYLKLKEKLSDQKLLNNPKSFASLSQEFHHKEKLYKLIIEYENINKQITDNKNLLKQEKSQELLALAKEDNQILLKKLAQTKEQLKRELLPKDPHDRKNIILEIRAGAGGDEACLFVQNLWAAYEAYAESQGWKRDIISISQGNVGGYKELIASISGQSPHQQGVYSHFKYESGVHRVQRVPKTESQGRIHTSTITVVVLPEADPVQVEIRPSDLRIDACKSSGAGGQHVNTTDSAVRIVHLPTKITVYCQQEKSQHANKEKAMKILYARLLDKQTEERKKEDSKKRQNQMGTGDRSQRIRTYNFPQSRLTDHRIPITKKNLPGIMTGGFSELFLALKEYYQNKALKEG